MTPYYLGREWPPEVKIRAPLENPALFPLIRGAGGPARFSFHSYGGGSCFFGHSWSHGVFTCSIWNEIFPPFGFIPAFSKYIGYFFLIDIARTHSRQSPPDFKSELVIWRWPAFIFISWPYYFSRKMRISTQEADYLIKFRYPANIWNSLDFNWN